MNILVTGVSGFSGSFVSNYLSKKHNVFGIFRNENSIHLKKIIKNKDINFTKIDILEINESKLNKLDSIDVVVHIGSSSPMPEMKTYKLVYDNLFGLQNLINWSVKKKCKKFIFYSSMSAFGNILTREVDEETISVSPDVYGQTKLISEKILEEEGKFQFISLRLPGIVGPGSKRNWISSVRDKLLKNEKVNIFNKNSEFNNLVHIKDLALFTENLFLQDFKHKFLVIGSKDKKRIKDIVELIKKNTNSTSELEFNRKGKKSFTLNSHLARKFYGLETMTLDKSLSMLLER